MPRTYRRQRAEAPEENNDAKWNVLYYVLKFAKLRRNSTHSRQYAAGAGLASHASDAQHNSDADFGQLRNGVLPMTDAGAGKKLIRTTSSKLLSFSQPWLKGGKGKVAPAEKREGDSIFHPAGGWSLTRELAFGHYADIKLKQRNPNKAGHITFFTPSDNRAKLFTLGIVAFFLAIFIYFWYQDMQLETALQQKYNELHNSTQSSSSMSPMAMMDGSAASPVEF